MNIPDLLRPLTLCLALFLNGSFLSAQSSDVDRWLDIYRLRFQPEKIYVHTDKDLYTAGEVLWAAVYAVDGQTHLPGIPSKLIHLELRDAAGGVVLSRKVDPADGHAASDLTLPGNLLPGRYDLVAYTTYQRNGGEEYLFRKPLRILRGLPENGPPAGSPPSFAPLMTPEAGANRLRFFPEGGDCLTGIPCRVALLTEGRGGQPISRRLTLNGEGLDRAEIVTSPDGFATLTYTPLPGRQVVATMDGKRFDFPPPLPRGIHLSVEPLPDMVHVHLRATGAKELAGSTFLLHLRGIPLVRRTLPATGTRADFRLPRHQLPAGVLTATVFDPAGVPVAERLFFVPPSNSRVRISLSATEVPTRSSARIQLEVPTAGLPAELTLDSSRLSLSVLPAYATGGIPADDIRSWLLLNSDLDRPLSVDPGRLFSGEERTSLARVDGYLLTRGWRRFRWSDLQRGYNTAPPFLLEEGIFLRGQMTQYENGKDGRPGKVFLSKMENGFSEEAVTDLEGNFRFGPYRIYDSLAVVLQGRFRPGKRNRQNPEIDLEDNPYVRLATTEPASPALTPRPRPVETGGLDRYADRSRDALIVARNYDSLIVNLDVVDVGGKRIDPEELARQQRTALYGQPDARIDVAESSIASTANTTVLDLLRTVPGVTVTGTPFNPSVSIRGVSSITLSNDAALFVDGIQVPLSQAINTPAETVDFIDVLKGGRAAIFGMNGTNGVILVYTKRGGAVRSPRPGLLLAQIHGYHRVRQFADFADQQASDGRPDLRTTLHWSPLLRTDARGRVTDTFRTSDQTGTFHILVQGIRPDGLPLSGTATFEVR